MELHSDLQSFSNPYHSAGVEKMKKLRGLPRSSSRGANERCDGEFAE